MELIGRRFGHIRITDVVGQGGMGDVYSGYDEKLDRTVALKVLHAENRLDAEARERLLREARALSKLDHPNICRIYDYIESEDVDVLVLEYIDGQTLQDVLMDHQLSRADKLRMAIAVAEVLVAAHRLGIIHRDLKPENVMITRNGEVKVLDFGLARWLNLISTSKRFPVAASAEGIAAAPAAGAVPLPDESDHEWFAYADVKKEQTTVLPAHRGSTQKLGNRFLRTEAGVTMGTPIFMSPEQARGEELTTASDMYAFGLFLQSLFTGIDPHPLGLPAREVILRAARGETIPVSGVSGDVAALINRLKQFAPADRPTAVETVARLRYLADKPARILRRAVIASAIVAILFASWRYTTDLARERTIAVKARQEAETRRAQAEGLIGFMVGDLRNKLAEVGRLDILDAAGERTLQYVASLRPEMMSVTDLVNNAKSLNLLGDVRLQQGKTLEALNLFGRSLHLAREAAKRNPKNPEVLVVLGQTHFWIGNSLQKQARNDDALVHMREYMKTGDALAAIDPNNRDYVLERAYGHSTVAYVLEQKGQLAEALEHYRTSLAIREELARRNTADAEAQAEVAPALNKMAVVYYKQGNLPASRDFSRREVDLYRRLVVFQPLQTQWKTRLGSSIRYYARTLEDVGEPDRAFPLWQEAHQIANELAERDPENVEWQWSVANSLKWLADATARRGDLAQGVALYRQATAKIADVIKQAPSRASYRLDQINIEIEYARLLAQQKNPAGVEILEASIRKLEPTAEARARFAYARASFALGEILSAREPQKASTAFEQAEHAIEPIVSNAEPRDIALWIEVLLRRGRIEDARSTLARLDRTGYATTRLKKICTEKGC